MSSPIHFRWLPEAACSAPRSQGYLLFRKNNQTFTCMYVNQKKTNRRSYNFTNMSLCLGLNRCKMILVKILGNDC